ncbi:MAG: 4-amino-4-deoxy-L-arabinose transferase, partial [Patescibacteria group bacterium]
MQKEIFSREHIYLYCITILAAILRIYGLDQYPPALYSDEVSQGYNAYSILKTGRDEFGTWLPVS